MPVFYPQNTTFLGLKSWLNWHLPHKHEALSLDLQYSSTYKTGVAHVPVIPELKGRKKTSNPGAHYQLAYEDREKTLSQNIRKKDT